MRRAAFLAILTIAVTARATERPVSKILPSLVAECERLVPTLRSIDPSTLPVMYTKGDAIERPRKRLVRYCELVAPGADHFRKEPSAAFAFSLYVISRNMADDVRAAEAALFEVWLDLSGEEKVRELRAAERVDRWLDALRTNKIAEVSDSLEVALDEELEGADLELRLCRKSHERR